MIRRFALSGLFCLLVTCTSMAAGTITFNGGQPNANPNGAKGVVEGTGAYAVGAGETYGSIYMYAELDKSNPPQITGVGANKVVAPNWEAKLASLGPADYHLWATLTTVDGTGTPQYAYTYGNNLANRPKLTVK